MGAHRFKILVGMLSISLGMMVFLPASPTQAPVAVALPATPLPQLGCQLSQAVATGGKRRLALLVGINDYQSDAIPDLKGPINDVRAMHALLTSPTGYGFPVQNVCVLLDAQATTEKFRATFDAALVQRAQPGDSVVIFFAGHGSQAPDKNGDEPDERDETLLLQDSKVNGMLPMRDDEFNSLLARLYKRTENVTVILDACNSGSATRDGMLTTRTVPPETVAETRMSGPEPLDSEGDGGGEWAPASMPGLTFLAGAGDGTPANERDGRGLFTSALQQVLGQANSPTLTWAQVARQLPPLIAGSAQIPYFQGDLDKPVFGGSKLSRPQGWEVASIKGSEFTLRGVALPGWTKGAQVRVYPGDVTPADAKDPAKALATLELSQSDGLTAKAVRVDPASAGERGVKAGDLAVLVRPGDEAVRLKLRIRPATVPGGVSKARADALQKAVADDPQLKDMISIVNGSASFELISSASGVLQLLGADGKVRNSYTAKSGDEASLIARSLWQHARQQALLQLQGEGGQDFADGQTLKVQVIPAAKQDACANGIWTQAPPNSPQAIPLCYQWQIKVSLAADAPNKMLVGGLVLFSDGGIYGFPLDGSAVRIEPGGTYTFPFKMKATPPLDIRDHLLVFATAETEQVSWKMFTEPAVASSTLTRGTGGLTKSLMRYVTPGTRGGTLAAEDSYREDKEWTMSYIPLTVEANTKFTTPEGAAQPTTLTREYTIAKFDVSPYLPDDQNTALYKVLNQQYALARHQGGDGVPYKQHEWKQSTDAANLKLGIDCSRAIWFAFTRAGLPYTKGNQYLTTAGMVAKGSPLSEHFERCDDAPTLQLGDVLVYRDETRSRGHVVMVIDPEKRIAWGSHGWDGNVLEQKKGMDVLVDRGVEYQRIKYKKDWERWDSQATKRVACWRYKTFVAERQAPGGQPGMAALNDACNVDKCAAAK